MGSEGMSMLVVQTVVGDTPLLWNLSQICQTDLGQIFAYFC